MLIFLGCGYILIEHMYKPIAKRSFYLSLALMLVFAGSGSALAHEALGQTEDQVINQPPDSDTDSPGGLKSRFQEQKQKLQQRQQQVRQNLQEKRDQLKQQAQERQAQFQEKRLELKRKLHDRQAERVAAFVKRMLGRFEAAIGRLNHLFERISSRLDKLAAEDKDVSAQRSSLGAAKVMIEAAQVKLQEARISLEAVVPSEDPHAQFADAKTKLNAVKEEIKAAHAALVDVINSIKEGLIKKNN